MIFVDTSVGVDVLNDNDTKQARPLCRVDETGEPIALTDIVFTEILQGLRIEEEAELVAKTLDCLIAAPCVRTGAPLLHADADFDRLAACTDLRLYPPA